MKCTDKEWDHCRVEKMGCFGCYYNDNKKKNKISLIKRIMLVIVIVLFTPIYLFIIFAKGSIELITEMTQPFADGISDFVDNMVEFWEKIFKLEE